MNFLKSSDNVEKNKKMKNLPENSPKWPQKSKIDFKNENFEKKWKILKSSDNLQKM